MAGILRDSENRIDHRDIREGRSGSHAQFSVLGSHFLDLGVTGSNHQGVSQQRPLHPTHP